MECVDAKKHPNADSLNIYEFKHNDKRFQIVANMENTYNIGDRAKVVLEGVLKTGEIIRSSAIRGVKSYGMALGKTDLPLGTNLTSELCQDVLFKSWPSIAQLHEVRKGLTDKIKYRAKIKLHGTNAAVQVRKDGSIITQSRDIVITPSNDNRGFATWVSKNTDLFKINMPDDCSGVVIFGEWYGQGILNSKFEKKIFCVFAIQLLGDSSKFIYEPKDIESIITPNHDRDLHVLPWLTDEVEMDFSTEMENQINFLNNLVEEIEKCDPWMFSVFKTKIVGEGIVMYPMIKNADYMDLSNYLFKAKGKEHRVVNNTKPVQLNPEMVKSVESFCDLFCTENRFQQFANPPFDFSKTGQFIKIILADIEKESTSELEVSGLTWSDVTKALSNRAKNWWVDKCKQG